MALGLREHLSEVYSSAAGKGTSIVNVLVTEGIDASQNQDFSRFFDIQGSDSGKPIPGAISMHIPFPQTGDAVETSLKWFELTIAKLAPLFESKDESSIYQQTLNMVLEERQKIGKTDDAAFTLKFQEAWDAGWLKNSIFVGLLTHMTSVIPQNEDVKRTDPSLPSFSTLSVILEGPNRNIIAPLPANNGKLGDVAAAVSEIQGYLEDFTDGIRERYLGSGQLSKLVPIEDYVSFGDSFRVNTAEGRATTHAERINYVLDYCAEKTRPLTAKQLTVEQVEGLLGFISESANASPREAGGIYAAVLEHMTAMEKKSPAFNTVMKKSLFPMLCQGLLTSNTDSAEKLQLLKGLLAKMEVQMTAPGSGFHEIFKSTNPWHGPMLSLNGQAVRVSSTFKDQFDALQNEADRLFAVKADLQKSITEMLEVYTDSLNNAPSLEKVAMLQEALTHFYAQRKLEGTFGLTQEIFQEIYPRSSLLLRLYPEGLSFDEVEVIPALEMSSAATTSLDLDESASSGRESSNNSDFSDSDSTYTDATPYSFDDSEEDDAASVVSADISVAAAVVHNPVPDPREIEKTIDRHVVELKKSAAQFNAVVTPKEKSDIRRTMVLYAAHAREILEAMGREAVEAFNGKLKKEPEFAGIFYTAPAEVAKINAVLATAEMRKEQTLSQSVEKARIAMITLEGASAEAGEAFKAASRKGLSVGSIRDKLDAVRAWYGPEHKEKYYQFCRTLLQAWKHPQALTIENSQLRKAVISSAEIIKKQVGALKVSKVERNESMKPEVLKQVFAQAKAMRALEERFGSEVAARAAYPETAEHVALDRAAIKDRLKPALLFYDASAAGATSPKERMAHTFADAPAVK